MKSVTWGEGGVENIDFLSDKLFKWPPICKSFVINLGFVFWLKSYDDFSGSISKYLKYLPARKETDNEQKKEILKAAFT